MGAAAAFQNNTKLCSVNHESWQGSNKGVTPDVSDTWTITKDSCISTFILLSERPPLILWLMLSFHLLGKITAAPLKVVEWQSWVSGVELPSRLSFGQLPLHSFRFILRQLHLAFLPCVFIAYGKKKNPAIAIWLVIYGVPAISRVFLHLNSRALPNAADSSLHLTRLPSYSCAITVARLQNQTATPVGMKEDCKHLISEQTSCTTQPHRQPCPP